MHTPGPWIVDESCGNEVRQPKGSNRRRIKLPPDHDGIEDARLVAAAPNLLQAAEIALRWMTSGDTCRVCENSRNGDHVHECPAVALKDAIDKAKEDAWNPHKERK